jgi:integrase
MTAATREIGAERLTDRAIREWLRGQSPTLHDGGGLYLRRRGAGAFWALRQVNATTGARTWAGLFPGVPYPAASLASARRKATEARLRATDAPTDLVRERKATLAAQRANEAAAALAALRRKTVRQLFDDWQRVELAPQVLADGTRTGRKDGGEWVKAAFERRVFPKLGDVPAEGVKRADLLAILDDAKADGHRRTANVLLADLRQMFRFAAEREIVQRNPLEGIKRASIGGKDTERDRVLSDDALLQLWRAVPEARLSQRSAAAIWLILATAARVGEAMGARWEHIDLKARTWYLPDTKNQRDHTIHLSDFALRQFEVLASLREQDEDGKPVPWVFPATNPHSAVCIKSFGKQLADRQREPAKRMSNRTKATNALLLPGGKWTAHDLRRTAATLMARLGVSTDVIDECLNHKLQSKVARVYIKDRRLIEQARAFDALGKRLETLTEGYSDASNVVPLRSAIAR